MEYIIRQLVLLKIETRLSPEELHPRLLKEAAWGIRPLTMSFSYLAIDLAMIEELN